MGAKLEFTFAGSTTRFGAVSTEINGWLSIETLVTGIHRWVPDMTSRLATLCRRVRMPYPGRICRFCPFRALTWRLMIGSCIPVRMTMVPRVLSTNSTLIQLHNQLPYNRTNNVTRYHIQNGSSWSARISLMYCQRLTVLSLHSATSVSTDTNWLYHPDHSPSLVFLFLRQWSITFRKFSKN